MAVDTMPLDWNIASPRAPKRATKVWAATWPKLLAVALFIGAWQVIVWTGWKSQDVLPSPFTVFNDMFHNLGDLSQAAFVTLKRAVVGFAVAIAVGSFIGIAVARSRILRAG